MLPFPLSFPLVDVPFTDHVKADFDHAEDLDGRGVGGEPSYFTGIDWGKPGGDSQAVHLLEVIAEPGADELTGGRVPLVPGRNTADGDPQRDGSPRVVLIHTFYDPACGYLSE